MKKLTAKDACEILNSVKADGFIEAIRARIDVTDSVANLSPVNCSPKDSGGFDSSPLGFIQMFCDELICFDVVTERFMSATDGEQAYNDDFDRYLDELKWYNKKHGTKHQPEERHNHGFIHKEK